MHKRYLTGVVTLLMALLTSCGGGGGVGSGGTGISAGASGVGIGSISGFGSIIVSDIRYNIDSAAVTLDDASALKLGMTVRVEGSVNPDLSTGTAARVASAAEMRGQVSAIDAGSLSFVVLGNTVTVDEATIFDGAAGFASLANADTVLVYGLPSEPGSLRATRVERVAAGAAPVVTGRIESLDTRASTLRIGQLTIDYAAAGFTDGLTSHSLVNGLLVRVRATQPPGAGGLSATRIQPWHSVPGVTGTSVSLAGVMTDFASLGSFKLLGISMDASAAQVTGGPANAIGNGVKIEVTGVMNNGIVAVSKLKLKNIPGTGGPASFSLTGAIGNHVSAANFRVQGQPVDASGAGVIFGNGSVGDLANGVKVTVLGSQVINGALIASRVTFD